MKCHCNCEQKVKSDFHFTLENLTKELDLQLVSDGKNYQLPAGQRYNGVVPANGAIFDPNKEYLGILVVNSPQDMFSVALCGISGNLKTTLIISQQDGTVIEKYFFKWGASVPIVTVPQDKWGPDARVLIRVEDYLPNANQSLQNGLVKSTGSLGGDPDCPGGWSMDLNITNSTNQTMYLRSGIEGTFSIAAGDTKNYTQFPNHTTFEIDWGGDGQGHGILGETGGISFSNGGGISITPGGTGSTVSVSGTADGEAVSATGSTNWQGQTRSCTNSINVTFKGQFAPPKPAYKSGTTIVNNLENVNVTVASSGQTVPPIAPGKSWHGDNANTVSATAQTSKGISQGSLSVTPQQGVVFTMTAATGNDVEIKVTATPTGKNAVTKTFSTPSSAPVTIVEASSWPGGVVEVDFNPLGSSDSSGKVSFC